MRKFSVYIYTQYIFKGCDDSYKVDDGYCDDENNNAKCYYDGGDCCGPHINREYCDDCICYPHETCISSFFYAIGNGHCDDFTNTETCNFDGGDCCGPCSNKHTCSDCSCLEETEIDPYCK